MKNIKGLVIGPLALLVLVVGSLSSYAVGPRHKSVSMKCPPPKGPKDDVVAFWGMQELSGSQMKDSMKGLHDGTYNGGVTLGQPGPLLSSPNVSVLFDGTSGYAQVPNSPDLLPPKFTIEAWVNPNNQNPANQRILEIGGAFIGGGYGIEYSSGPGAGYIFYLLWSSPTTYVGVSSDQALPLNQWSFIAATFDGLNLSLFINGNKQTATAQTTLTQTNQPLTIGKLCSSNANYFHGNIADVILFDVVLTDGQIKNHYTQAGY